MLGETTLIIGFAIDEHQGIFSHEKTDDGDWRYIYRVEKENYRGFWNFRNIILCSSNILILFF